jgi:hypothetical protein
MAAKRITATVSNEGYKRNLDEEMGTYNGMKMKYTHYQKPKVCPDCNSKKIYHPDGNDKTDYELHIIGYCIVSLVQKFSTLVTRENNNVHTIKPLSFNINDH